MKRFIKKKRGVRREKSLRSMYIKSDIDFLQGNKKSKKERHKVKLIADIDTEVKVVRTRTDQTEIRVDHQKRKKNKKMVDVKSRDPRTNPDKTQKIIQRLCKLDTGGRNTFISYINTVVNVTKTDDEDCKHNQELYKTN